MKKLTLIPFFLLILNGISNAQTDVINIIPSGNVGISSTAPVSSLEVGGSYGQKVTVITANTTLDATYNTVVCNNGSTAIAVTLPTASAATGRIYVIKRNAASTANVTVTPTPTLDGQSSYILTMPNQSIEVFSDGSEWKTSGGGLSANGSAWNLSGNTGTTASTSPIGAAANNNFIGTTDAKDFVMTSSGLERMRITSGGNIGIGTVNPEVQLHLATQSTSTPRGLMVQQSNNANNSPFIILRKDRGTLGSPAAIANGDALGTIYSEAYDGTAFTRTGSNIKFQSNGTVASGSVPSDILFNTGSSGVGTERMRILSTGEVGIGTSAPLAKLHVNADAAAGELLIGDNWFAPAADASTRVNIGNTAANTTIKIGQTSTDYGSMQWTYNATVANGYFSIFTVKGGTNSGNLVLQNLGGNVGIGLVNTNAKLDVLESGLNTAAAQFIHTNATNSNGLNIQTQTAIAADYGLRVVTNAGANHAFIVRNTGNVGIGTTSPVALLNLTSSAASTNLHFNNAATGTSASDGGSVSVHDGGSFQFTNFENSAFTFNIPGVNEKMRIESSGNVGIGVTTPAHTLQVGQSTPGNNTNYSVGIYRHGDPGTPGTYSANTPAIQVRDVAGDGPASAESSGMLDIAAPRIADADANAANALLLSVSNDNGYALTVKGNRNVGIGTSAPAQRLEVSGNARVTGLASGGNGAIVRSNSSGDLSVTNFSGSASDVLTGAGTFVGIGTISGDDWTQSGSLLYPNNTTWNVGVGTSSPAAKLHVSSDVSAGGTKGITFQGSVAESNNNGRAISVLRNNGTEVLGVNNEGIITLNTTAGTNTVFIDPRTNLHSWFNTGGNLGVGNNAPGFRLDVTGNARIGNTGGVVISSLSASRVNFRPSISNGDIAITDDSGTPARGITIINGGNLGVGTDAPAQKLEVAGGARVTALASGGSGAIVKTNSSGDMSVTNFSGSGTDVLTGAGTFVGISTISGDDWTQSGSNLYPNTLTWNVGVGTSSPGRKLEVYGTAPGVKLNDPNASGNSFVELGTLDGGLSYFQNYQGRTRIFTGSSESITFLTNGNVGVGASAPGARFEVRKNDGGNAFRFANFVDGGSLGSWVGTYGAEFRTVTSTATHGMLINHNEANDARHTLDISDANGIFATFTNGKVGIGNPSPSFKLDVTGSARIGATGGVTIASVDANTVNLRPSVGNGDILISDDSGALARGLTVANGGNVGIGTDTPAEKLNVIGNARMSGLAGTGNRTVFTNSSGTLITGSSLTTPTSCKEIKTANPLSPNGFYSIDPDGGGALPAVPCYCDMTTNGGGWTKLNSALTGITVSKGTAAWNSTNGEDIHGTGLGSGCGVTPTQYTLSTPSVAFTEVYALLTRTTSILQCSAITGQTGSGWYNLPYRGTYTSNGTCLWSDGVWANGTETNMAGLRLNWVLFSNASNSALVYSVQCDNPTDNGAFTMQWFVR